MSAESTFEVGGTLILADIVRLQYFHIHGRSHFLTILCSIFILMGAIGIGAVMVGGDLDRLVNPGLFHAGMLCSGLLLLATPYISAKRQYGKQTYLREPVRYEFTDGGIRVQGASFSSEMAWPLIQAVYETKSGFLLYHHRHIAWIL